MIRTILLSMMTTVLFAAPQQLSLEEALSAMISHAKTTCFRGDKLGCQLVGESLSVGNAADRNYHEAIKYFAQGCKLKNASSCTHLAHAYEHGLGIRQDITEAHELYGEACDYGLQEGCDNFSRISSTLRK